MLVELAARRSEFRICGYRIVGCAKLPSQELEWYKRVRVRVFCVQVRIWGRVA
jgi:hypothetical protein